MGFTRRSPAVARILKLAGAGAVLLLSVLLVAGFAGSALAVGALYVLPAVAVALALLCGRYPGEMALARLRRARTGRRAPTARVLPPLPHPARLLRGGRLIGASLAGRAPPLAAGWR